MSIIDIVKKIKYERLYMISVVILTSTVIVGLALLYKLNEDRGEIQIKALTIENSDKYVLVASKNGKKYHLPYCSGASRISEANKIYFDSYAEAQKAGYSKAAGCLGLK